MTTKGAVWPSAKVVRLVTAPGPPSSSSGTATTWLFVKMSPSERMMMPEPSEDNAPTVVSSFTTLGSARAAPR